MCMFLDCCILFVQVLINAADDGQLPRKPKQGGLRADEHLSVLLNRLGVPDADIQRFSARSHLGTGHEDQGIAHVCLTPLQSARDTDNAWTEADVWSVRLR